MLFAILFIAAFLAGLTVYYITRDWKICVALPMILYALSVFLDEASRAAWTFSLLFGLPIVFFGALLGAYVYQVKINPD